MIRIINALMVILLITCSSQKALSNENSVSLVSTETMQTLCSREHGVCNLPANHICHVDYGWGHRWTRKNNVFGSIGCNNGVFGDPWYGQVKACRYVDCRPAIRCANEHGVCHIPNGQQCTVTYGMGHRFVSRGNIKGSIGCNNNVFGDPFYGTVKACVLTNCRNCANSRHPGPRHSGPKPRHCQRRPRPRVQCTRQPKPRGFNPNDYCARENGNCKLPAGQICDVAYGWDNRWSRKDNVYGNIPCNNGTFGDPFRGQGKACKVTNCRKVNACANENGTCVLPAGQQCDVHYGMGANFTVKRGLKGNVSCNNGFFGDPNRGIFKACYFTNCQAIRPPIPPRPTRFNVQGEIIDGVTGLLIKDHVTVAFKRVANGEQQHFAAMVINGKFSITLDIGTWSREVRADGYTEHIRSLNVNKDINENVALNQKTAGWRFILQWDGKVVKDLDAIVQFDDGQMVYYNDPNKNYGGGKAHLDLDSRDGTRPETITLTGIKQGTATYMVQNYSKEKPIGLTNAKISLYKDGKEMTVMSVKPSATATFWYAIKLNFATNEWERVDQYN